MAVRESSGQLYPVCYIAKRFGVTTAMVHVWITKKRITTSHVVAMTNQALFELPDIEDFAKRYAKSKGSLAEAKTAWERDE